MTDTSHLVAIYERLQREKARLSAATTSCEVDFRSREVKAAEKELEAEYRFLGMTPTAMLDEISDDDLLSELTA